jgi:hypothetical protein
VVGRRVLAAVLAAEHVSPGRASSGLASSGLAGVWPSAVTLGIITAVLGLAGVIIREQQRILSELTSRYAQDRILDVTCAVELAAFDQPEFHDRAARAQVGVMRAPQMVFGLQGLAFDGGRDRGGGGTHHGGAAADSGGAGGADPGLGGERPAGARVLRFRRRHDPAGP